jgi:hypothetical protein
MDTVPLDAGAPAHQDPSTAEETARYVVAQAIWAPSVRNTQPWWFSAGGQQISLYADAGRRLAVADPDGREMMIRCGAALFTVRLVLRSLGYIPETRVLPDPAQPALVAHVSWRRQAAPTYYKRRLAGQVPLRRTHRGGFDPVPLSLDLLASATRPRTVPIPACCCLGCDCVEVVIALSPVSVSRDSLPSSPFQKNATPTPRRGQRHPRCWHGGLLSVRAGRVFDATPGSVRG